MYDDAMYVNDISSITDNNFKKDFEYNDNSLRFCHDVLIKVFDKI